jgi:hypothetical protein
MVVIILPLHLNIIHKEYNCTSVNMKTSAHARQDTICAELAGINLSRMTCKYKGNEYCSVPTCRLCGNDFIIKERWDRNGVPWRQALFLYHVTEVGA